MSRIEGVKFQKDMEFINSPKKWSVFLANNGYKRNACIGNGSFGDVYAVTRLDTGDRMAVKRLVARHNISEDETFLAESRALVSLRHENIVQLKEIVVSLRVACIVLELAPYGNLELLAEKLDKKFEPGFILTAFQQTASAVSCCHDACIAHRDINPSNILVFGDRLVKLADFGLSFRCRDATSGQDILCTDYLGHDSYLAPEVKRGRPYLAKPADVWSLGCLLCFMITCAHPVHNCNEIHVTINDWLNMVSNGNKTLKMSLSGVCQINPDLRPLVSHITTHLTTYSKSSTLDNIPV